jgi:ABC-type lipoprotein export system ATPase subunit
MNEPTRARLKKKNFKLMIWGDSGTGKTSLSLNFPRCCVIDTESGSLLYDTADHSVLSATTSTRLRQPSIGC